MTFDHATESGPVHPSSILPGWFVYLCFVVYGSLVPLDFHARSLGEAWAAFQQLPILQIDLQGRADLIANAVLYVPLAFLTASMVSQDRSWVFRFPAWLGTVVFCCALAIAVEFVQLFFPPRTVSMNDVAAEGLGSLIGATIAWRWAGQFRILLGTYLGNPAELRIRLIEAYILAYLIFSLFPYDFLLSGAELAQKLNSGSWAWFLADQAVRGGVLVATAKLAAEALAAIPFGLLLGRWSKGSNGLFRGFALGAILGLFIEVAQFFIFSGISQGASVITRGLGVGAGLLLWRANWDMKVVKSGARRFAPALVSLYFLALAAVNGWFGSAWGNEDLALGKLRGVHLVPFYYHYYTSESIALVSVISVVLMYAPIGIFSWTMGKGSVWCAFAAALIACAVEGGKLFLVGDHPDPTDIFIAALAAWATWRLLDRLSGVPAEMKAAVPETVRRVAAEPAHAVQLGFLLLSGWGVASFPFHPFLLALLLCACGVLIWRRPPLLVVLIPAALPVFDLAQWSGRFYFDEFDFLLLVSIAVGYARVPARPRGISRDRLFPLLAALLGASYAIGTVRGLLPWQVPDANSFTSYYSPYNALRVAKGALWAVLLYGLLFRLKAAGENVRSLFAWGMVLGLSGTVAVVAWERLTFSGLFNFSNDYRATGPFSQAHIGSAYIEGFLTAAAPFLVLLILQTRRLSARLAGGALLLGTTYALMVTFSRSAYAAYGIALAIVLLGAWVRSARRGTANLRRGLAALVLAGTALAVALPIFRGSFAQARMSQVGADVALRVAHWRDGLGMIAPDRMTSLFGMGIGRYPETHYWRSREEVRAAGYRLATEDGNTFLRLGTGSAIYMEQVVAVKPARQYLLSLDARGAQPNASVNAWVCEKWLLASYECFSQAIELGRESGAWRHYELHVASGDIGRGPWYARRPVKLALSNPNKKSVVDVDNVRLTDADGHELLSNGDFSKGLDRWLFSVDDYWPWHIESLPLTIYFDQGWLGLVAAGLLVALALGRAVGGALRGDFAAVAVLASLAGFLAVGLLNSLVDTPRFLLLFLLLLWLASQPEQNGRENRSEVLPQRLRHGRS